MPKPKALYLTLVALILPLQFAGGASAGPHGGAFGVSAQVVAPHRPALAAALPMPVPGHVMQEDASGRHYFFDGELHAASRFLDGEMHRRGYALVAFREAPQGQAMRWEREGEVVEVALRSAFGAAPTRVTLRVSSPGLSK